MNGWTFGEAVTLIPVVACAFAFVGLYRRSTPFRPGLPLLLFFALAIRWFVLVRFPNPSGDLGFDAESYRIVGALVRSGRDVYASTDRHPYLPFQMYFMGLASWLAANTDPHFFSWVRWPNILADLGITVLIYRSTVRLGRGESEAFWLTLIWAVHPVSIYTSTIHGQFDSVAVFFALWSWYFVRFWPGWRGAVFGGMALGFAVLDKTWPLILLPALVVAAPEVRRRVVFLAGAGMVPLAGIAVYGATIGTTLHLIQLKVVNYDAVPGRYGFTYAFSHYLNGNVPPGWLPYFQEHGRDIFLVSVAMVAAIVVPRRDSLTSCVALLAGFLVFAHGWGSQYLVWILPFAIVARQRAMLAAYSAVATAALLVYYWGTCGYHCPGRLSNTWEYWQFEWIWPLVMVWLAREALAALWMGRAPDPPYALAVRSLRDGWRPWRWRNIGSAEG